MSEEPSLEERLAKALDDSANRRTVSGDFSRYADDEYPDTSAEQRVAITINFDWGQLCGSAHFSDEVAEGLASGALVIAPGFIKQTDGSLIKLTELSVIPRDKAL